MCDREECKTEVVYENKNAAECVCVCVCVYVCESAFVSVLQWFLSLRSKWTDKLNDRTAPRGLGTMT